MHNTSISAKKSKFFIRDRPRDRFRPRKKKFFFVIVSDSVFQGDHFGILFLKIRPLEPILNFFWRGPGPKPKTFARQNINQKHSKSSHQCPVSSPKSQNTLLYRFTSGLVADTCDPFEGDD